MSFNTNLTVEKPPASESFRDTLERQGFSFGKVIGYSVNCGFTVTFVEQGRSRFAAKCTWEGDGEGTLRSTLCREYQVLQRLRHPHIVRVECFVEADIGCAMLMELCPGASLELLIPDQAALPSVLRPSVLQQVLLALAHLHSSLVAHRDLHAANVMAEVSAVGETGSRAATIKLIDFGSACCVGATVAASGSAATLDEDVDPRILPPGRAGGGYGDSFSCDVFAIGLMAVGLMTQRLTFRDDVFSGEALALPSAACDGTVPGREAISFVRALLSIDPHARPSAEAALDALPPAGSWLSHTTAAQSAVA